MGIRSDILKVLFIPIVLVAAFMTGQPVRAAEAGNLQASVNGQDPYKPILTLKNSGNSPCQVVNSALGTVAITKVVQDGQTIQPIDMETSFDEDLKTTLTQKLQTLKPGESIDIPLRVYPFKSGQALEAITWSDTAGSFGLLYAVQAKKPLQLELTYVVPITPNNGPAVCDMAFANITSKKSPKQFITILAIVLFVIIIIIGMIWLFRTRRRQAAASATLLIISVFSSLWLPSPARAAFTVPPSVSAEFNECMTVLQNNRDITGPILDILNNPAITVEIVHTTDGTNDTARYGENNYRIYWDPTTVRRYFGTGGNSDGCSSLFHEMYHAFDMNQGTFSRDDCGGSGIETKEVMATRAQNKLRERLGLPARSHYGDRALPTGDCTRPPSPQPCSGAGCADSNGDPHLRTFDGLRYDFQAAGEFIAARNLPGDFEIQVRQQPWPGSRTVAINTAVAAKVADDKVELRIEEQKLVLVVNGKKQELKDKKLPKGGAIAFFDENRTAVITWPDTSTTTVRSIGNFGLHLVVDPAAAQANKLEGLFGDFDDKKDNDLRVRGSDKTIQPKFDQLYPDFANSWRVNDRSSLFTYAANTNTATYTDRSFPYEDVNLDQLPNRTAAEALCRRMGVTDPEILTDCILDVALTSRAEFAKAAATGQIITTGADYGGTLTTLIINTPETTASTTFEATAGQKLFIDMFGTTLPDQCGILELRKPNDQVLTTGCLINGRGYIDGTVLPESGKYKIVLDPNGAATGQAKIRHFFIHDKTNSITPDGSEVTATIDKPGVVNEFTFAGTIGQRVFVHVPYASIDDDCGSLTLRDQADRVINSGCIINGKGYIDTTILPATGNFSVVVDPRERLTGQVKLRLSTAKNQTSNLNFDSRGHDVTLDKPGSIATFAFTGIAGQRIFVDVTKSSLPDQCGVISLHALNGQRIDSGCIINGKGELNRNGSVLPTTGQYLLTIDPASAATGDVTLKAQR